MVATVNIFVMGFVKSFGLVYVMVLDYFPHTPGSTAGWLIGLLVAARGVLSKNGIIKLTFVLRMLCLTSPLRHITIATTARIEPCHDRNPVFSWD